MEFKYKPTIRYRIARFSEKLSKNAEFGLKEGLDCLRKEEERRTRVHLHLERYERKKDIEGIAHLIRTLPRAFDDLTQSEMMRYLEMPYRNGRSVGYEVVDNGSIEVREKIRTISYRDKLFELGNQETGGTLAEDLIASRYVTPAEKAKILVSMRLMGKDEEELTRLILSNLITTVDERNRDLSYIIVNAPDFDFYSEINIVYGALADLTGLTAPQIEKLGMAIEGAETNVKKALAAKALSHMQVWFGMTNDREVFDFVMENCPTKKLLEALEHLPSIIELFYGINYRDGSIFTLEEAKMLLSSGNIEKTFMELAKDKIGVILKSIGIESISQESKEALRDNYFLTDLLIFESIYKYEPKKALDKAVGAFFKEGTEGFKRIKFGGHELAVEQLSGAYEIREKLMALDKISVSNIQKNGIPFDMFEGPILNYTNHKTRLHEFAREIRLEFGTELKKLQNASKSEELRSAIATADAEKLRLYLGKGQDSRIKGQAIFALNLLNSKEAIESVEELILELERMKDKSAAEQENVILVLSNRWRDKSYRNMVDALATLKQHAAKNNKIGEQALNDLLSILSTLRSYNKEMEENRIDAKITFDFSKLLTFGRYGSSGAGNCQKSTGPGSLNQSLMSMVLDANQFMILFNKANGTKPLGMMQVHLLHTREEGMIFLFEKPYTNEPNRATGMKEVAALLAAKIKEQTGIVCYESGRGEEVEVDVPSSYVKRYIDFAGGSVDERAFKQKVRIAKL